MSADAKALQVLRERAAAAGKRADKFAQDAARATAAAEAERRLAAELNATIAAVEGALPGDKP
jgi:hypothetical protein